MIQECTGCPILKFPRKYLIKEAFLKKMFYTKVIRLRVGHLLTETVFVISLATRVINVDGLKWPTV